jgi:hypothetical protein
MATCEFPEKLQFLFRPARYKVAYGGRGGSKSWGFARALLILGSKKQLRVLCAREFQNSIQESVHRLLSEQIESLGLSSVYEIQQARIIGKNGTEFIFAGLKTDPTKIKSAEGIDICWVEEAEKLSSASWDVLIPTIRKPQSEIWVSFNPHLQTDSTYQRFIAAPPPDAVVVEVSFKDNPWFPEELEKERVHLKSVDPEAYLHIWEGQCLSVGDNQMIGVEQAYAASERYYKEDQYMHAAKVIGVDVARYGGDRSVIYRRQGLMAFEPYVFKGVDNMTFASHVMEHINTWKPDGVMIDAGRGEGVIDRLRQVGHAVTEVNFGGKPINPKYVNKRAEMWDTMALWIKERGCITRNTDLIQDLTSPTYIFSNSTNKFQVESKELIKARGGKSPDLADALALTFAMNVVPKGFSVGGVSGNHVVEYDPFAEA